jgi:type VI secretion system protein ImpL
MRKVALIVIPILLAYLLIIFFTGSLLGLQGTKLWILRGALWLIGILAAAVVAWFFWDKNKKEKSAAAAAEEEPTGGEEIAVMLRDAEKKLASAQLAKGARIGNLSAILLLGEASSTKTTTMLHSGLEPELLAGQIYEHGNVTSTRTANLWYSHQTIFVEASGKLLNDERARTYLTKHLQPRKLGAVVGSGGQAPRAALVCVEIERISAGGQAMASTARNLRARLGEIAQSFGIQLPVYVLFTKTDRLSFFADFVRNLNNEEAAQPLGVTLPIPGAVSGVWAEEQTGRLAGVFDQIFRSLCSARPELLARENDAGKLPGTYEFPREFKKLRGSLVQFLVDLCRPSQLTVGPFLRGFYFSGVRPVIVQETAAAPEPSAEAPSRRDAPEATAMFRVPAGGPAASAAPRPRTTVSRKVPQWLFLTHFFNHVLLADRVAMGASGSSAKTDILRRILLISAAALCLIFCIGFTVSFILNKGLERQVDKALVGTTVAPAAGSLASVDALSRLEKLRQSLETLTDYNREGAPWSYRWGLYAGDELYPDVRRLYFSRFKVLLLGPTQNKLAAFLGGLPASPAPPATPAYDLTYDALKAYLITTLTSNHDKSTREFLSPVLRKAWSADASVDPERLQLAQKQFDFYSDELKLANPFNNQDDQTAVPIARNYLRHFGDIDRVYQTMKAGAPKTIINFNRQVSGSREYVVENYEVAGPFTKAGWSFMIEAIRNTNRYVHGEKWVLGDDVKVNTDPLELVKPLLIRYRLDYIKEWLNYLRGAHVVRYKDVKDASEKLNQLSGNQSHLLALFAVASQNIPWDDAEIAKALQPVQCVEPPASDRYIVTPNKEYAGALSKLQTEVEAVANSPTDTTAATQALNDAKEARNATKQLAQTFNLDPDSVVQNLLLEPIINLEAKLRGVGADDLNAGGKALCGQSGSVLHKYPFNQASTQDAKVDEVNAFFRKPDGLWRFYEDNLKRYLTKQDGEYKPAQGASVTLAPRFVEFFNRAAAFSDFLYAGGTQDPHFTYSLKPVATDTVQKIGLDIDGQKLDYTGGTSAAKQFTWQAGSHAAKGTYGAEGGSFSENGGTWAIFRLFGDADSSTPSAGGGVFFDWIIKTGNPPKPSMRDGKQVTVRLELDMQGAPPMFQKGFFSRLACVSEVAKP